VVTTFSVEFTDQAADDLGEITKTVAQRILDKIRWLSANCGSLTPAALAGDLAGIHKLRVGDYRVLYTLKNDTRSVRILRIRHRRDVYKNL
jgi:mRNA interferase RelE/StbE